MSARNKLVFSIGCVFGVFVVGSLGFMVIDGDRVPSFLDAAYMTVITLSTVGYSETWELSHGARLWTIGVIVFGIATVSYAFTSLLTLVVSGELRSMREKKKMEKSIEHLSDHTILCGYGRMGVLVAEKLAASGITIVVIEKDATREPHLRDAGIAYILGDATEEDTLMHAGLTRARALVLAMPSDADNVFVTLSAYTLCPGIKIISRAEQLSTQSKLTRAGASRVVCPQVIGATKIANLLTRPNVVDFVDFADRSVDLEIDEYRISPDSPIVGKSLRDSGIRRKTGAVVVAIKRVDGQALIGPDPDLPLMSKDTLILVGPSGVSDRLDQLESVD